MKGKIFGLAIFIMGVFLMQDIYHKSRKPMFTPNGGYIDTLLHDRPAETKRSYDSTVKAQEAIDSAYQPNDCVGIGGNRP